MPQFTSHAPGTPCWVDLTSPDPDASLAFYSAVFDWSTEDQLDDAGTRVYTMCSLNGLAVAGVGGQPPGADGMPAVWNTYVAVASCEATAVAVVGAGGTVMMPPMQVMDAGRMAIFVDPTGAAFSVWEAGEHFGAELTNEANTWSWNELHTRDPDTALPFYAEVFGWEYEAADMGPAGVYNVILGGENGGLGGIMNMPPGVPDMVPNYWCTTFTVDNMDASLELVAAAGGQVTQPPFPIPGIGTAAVVHDPANAVFQLIQPGA